MRLGHRIVRKLRSVRGETIAEVLVSTLIGALAVLMLAMAISVASKIVIDNRESMDQYYTESNVRAEGASGISYSDLIIKSGSIEVDLVGESSSGS